MQKVQPKQLYITILFTCIVCVTLYRMYDVFYFHTYHQRIYYDAIASVDTDEIILEDYEIFHDEMSSSYGNGVLQIKDANKIATSLPDTNIGDTVDVIITISFHTQEKETIDIINNYTIVLEDDTTSMLVTDEVIDQELIYASIVDANMEIQNDNHQVSYSLDIYNMQALKSVTKEYKMEAASIHNNQLRLGKLVSSKDLVNDYDTISLEYRYMIDLDKDIDDIDNYVVFRTISTTTKEYEEINNHGIYKHDDMLENKQISVVVILNKEDEEFIFSMDMEIDSIGVHDD